MPTVSFAPYAVPQFLDNEGKPIRGGTLETYLAGTSTPAATYADGAGAVANPTTITLDSAGRPSNGGALVDIRLDVAKSYKFVLKDSAGATVRTVDGILGGVPAGSVEGAALVDGAVTASKLGEGAARGNLISDTDQGKDELFEGLAYFGPNNILVPVKRKLEHVKYPDLDFGGKLDGSDDTAAFHDAMAYFGGQNGGTLWVPDQADTYLPAGFDLAHRTSLIGAAPYASTLRTDGANAVINIPRAVYYNRIENLRILQTGGSIKGIGIKSRGNAWMQFRLLRIEGFDRNIYTTQGLYHHYDTVQCIGGRINFDFFDAETNPLPYWNTLPDGWFNNCMVFDNCIADGGGNQVSTQGYRIQGSSITMNSPTAQRIRVGEGLGYNFLGNYDIATDVARGITLNQPYLEHCNNGYSFYKVRSASIEGGYYQGMADAQTMLKLDNAHVNWWPAASSQDPWVKLLDAVNNSVFWGRVSGVGAINLDATSRRTDPEKNPHSVSAQSSTVPASGSYLFENAVPVAGSTYQLTISLYRDGSPFDVQVWTIWRPSSGSPIIKQVSTGGHPLSVAVSGTGLNITNNGSLGVLLHMNCVNLTLSANT